MTEPISEPGCPQPGNCLATEACFLGNCEPRQWAAAPVRVVNPDQAWERLDFAERVCNLVGVTGAPGGSDRDKALTQAFIEWNIRYGRLARPVSDDEVLELAARREVIQNNAMSRLRREGRINRQQRRRTFWDLLRDPDCNRPDPGE